ncbi:MAG: HAD family phosphatase [bacterium]|nr:MAG: HAD family phosphatase [bacterium]
MFFKTVFFDFGGVYYSEGFRRGILDIAREVGTDGEDFFRIATDSVFSTGYVTGEVPERIFWDKLASETGLQQDLYPRRESILKAFQPNREMAALVQEVRHSTPVALLTDQTNWLYELDGRDAFLSGFDGVISSYEEGFSKREPEIFRIACARMNIFPEEGIFFDDNPGNVERAADFGIRSYLFTDAGDARDVLYSLGLFQYPDTGPEGEGAG